MKNQQKHFSILLIDGLTKVFFWFFAGISAVFVLLLIFHLLGFSPDGVNLNVELPTSFKVLEEGTFKLGENVSSITITEASGKVNFDKAPRILSVSLALLVLPLIAALLYILWLFKDFTKNVKLGKVFDSVNISHLKRIAYIQVGSWFYLQVLVTVYNLFIVQRFEFNVVQFSYTNGKFSEILILALFIWVLSHIFEKGAEMEEENRLTV